MPGPHPDSGGVPPHDLTYEEAVLGAALLSHDALTTARATLTGDEFYRPNHGSIWAAICAVDDAGHPVTAVTVAAELRTRRLLDDVGGEAELVSLLSHAPGVGHTATYARGIADHAIARRLIGAAGSITEAAYAGGDPIALTTHALGALAEVTARAQALDPDTDDGWADIAAVIAGGLELEQPDILPRTDGLHLFYTGKLNIIWGAPGVGKGWLACAAVSDVLTQGGSVVYIDWEDSDKGIVGRLQRLGTSNQAMVDGLRYWRPTGPIDAASRARVFAEVDAVNADLVILDGVAESMARQGLDENAVLDWYTWANLLARPLAHHHCGVIMVDHVVKNQEATNRYGRGSGAKLAVIDGVAYHVWPGTPFSTRSPGRFKVVIAKDRPSGIGANGETAVVVHVTPMADGEVVRLELAPPEVDRAADGAWIPTIIMGQVSDYLATCTIPVPHQAVLDHLAQQKPGHVRQAIQALIAAHHIAETRDGRTKVIALVEPYVPPERRHQPAPEPADLDEPPAGLFDDDSPAGSVTDLARWRDENL